MARKPCTQPLRILGIDGLRDDDHVAITGDRPALHQFGPGLDLLKEQRTGILPQIEGEHHLRRLRALPRVIMRFDGEAADHALLHEPGHAVVNRLARDPEQRGEFRQRTTRILLEKTEQAPIRIAQITVARHRRLPHRTRLL